MKIEIQIYKKLTLYLSVIIVLLIPNLSQASFPSIQCLNNGYTIATINGINTTKDEAERNMDKLSKKVGFSSNGEDIYYQYLYNKTHNIVVDAINTANQKLFEQNSLNIQDADFVQILNDASLKVKTQKLLLVAHSQGNLYANTFYDTVADEPGGVPSKSIGVYGVATPADHVAGGGKYITSINDSVINDIRLGGLTNVLAANAVINLPTKTLFDGHDFRMVYLDHEGDRITREIQESLKKLKNNDEQDPNVPCISPLKLTTTQKVEGAILASIDFMIENRPDNTISKNIKEIKSIGNKVYSIALSTWHGVQGVTLALGNIFSNLSASVVGAIPDKSSLTTILPDLSEPIKNEFAKTEPLLNDNLVALNDTEPVDVDPIIENPASVKEEVVASIKTTNPVTEEIPKQTTEAVVLETLPKIEEPPVYLASGGGGSSAPVDTTPPVITLNGNETEVVAKNAVYIDAGATAFDNVDGIINVTTTGTVDTSNVGTYVLTYSVTDVAGNPASKTRTVVIDDGAKLHHPSSVFVSGKYAYVVSSDSNSLEIIDVSNPTLLVHKGSVVHGVNGTEMFGPKSVAVSGNYAYVVSYSNALEVIDVSNPSLPVHKSTLLNNDGGAAIFRPNDIVVSGNYAYIVDYGGNSLEIVDISNPLVPVHKGKIFGEGMSSLYGPVGLFVSGNYVYTTSSLSNSFEIFDVSNPELPVRKSTLVNGSLGVSMNNPQSVVVSGNYAYVVSRGDNALEILDISNPEAPSHVGLIKNGDGGASLYAPISVAVSGNYAYVVSYVGSTLEVIDISNPALPTHKATLPNNIGGSALSYPSHIFISGNYAYISSTMSDALEIIDISNPILPVHVGKILNGEYAHATTPTVFSSEKKFNSFDFTDLKVVGSIDEANHTISLSVPNGTNITALAPTFTISAGATTIPSLGEGKDFTNPVNYLVYAEDGSTQNYIVTVTISPPLPPVPDTTPPAVTNYTFNGNSSDITINPTVANPLSLVVNSSENVNWMSIKIEKEDDAGIYKTFQSGSGCVDGTNTCAKSWDGKLSKGGLLQSGTYKVKLHIKDLVNNEFYDYLTPYVIKVDTSI